MQSQPAKPVAGLHARLSRIETLLGSDPKRADALAAELLSSVPGQPKALLFQGIARRLTGDPASAVDILAPLCRSWPDAPLPPLQLGLALRATGEREAAVQSMRRAVAIKPDFGDAWLALADGAHRHGGPRGGGPGFRHVCQALGARSGPAGACDGVA